MVDGSWDTDKGQELCIIQGGRKVAPAASTAAWTRVWKLLLCKEAVRQAAEAGSQHRSIDEGRGLCTMKKGVRWAAVTGGRQPVQGLGQGFGGSMEPIQHVCI